MRRHFLTAASVAVVTTLLASSAMAQQATPKADQKTQGQDEENLLEELQVTAERRSESVQDTALAISAFSDKTRENAGILTIQDMAQFTPGFTYNTAQDKPTIRGIGRQSNTFSIESPVANYWDGVYTSSVQDAGRRPIFIERTEILRGPQGALSGRGSIAGAINTISKRPTESFEAAVGGFAANYERAGVEGTVSGPITDSLRYRVNLARYVQSTGYFYNYALRNTAGTQPNNRVLLDLMLAGDIGENIDFFFKAATSDYSETRRRNGDFIPVQAGNDVCNPTAFGGLAPIASYGYFSPGPVAGPGVCGRNTGAFDPAGVTLSGFRQNVVLVTGNLRSFATDYHPVQDLDDGHNFTTDVVYHAPTFDLRYIGGHQQYEYIQSSDADGTDVVSLRLPYQGGITTNPVRTVNPGGINQYREQKTWYSHEINLTSKSESAVRWIAGLYNSNEHYDQQPQNLIYPGYAELNVPVSAASSAILEAPNAHPFHAQYASLNGISDSKAIFGQIDWKVTDKLKITGGLRYNKDKKDIVEEARFIQNSADGFANRVVGGVLSPISRDVSATSQPGFALVNPATFSVPTGYRLVDLTGQGTLTASGSCTATGQRRTIAGVSACSDFQALISNGTVAVPTIDPATGNRVRMLKGEWEALTGSLGVDYKPNDDSLIYLRLARGYRPGGFNAGFLFLRPDVDEEQVDSYELGGKFTLGGSFQINTAAFLYDYTNVQLPLPTFERCTDPTDFSTCINLSSYINLPSSVNKGLEIEGIWYPTANLQLIFSYGYLDAEIKNGRTATGFVNGNDPAAVLPTAQRLGIVSCAVAGASCILDASTGKLGLRDSITGLPQYFQDLSGNPLANSPPHKIAVNAAYTFQLPAGGLTVSSSYTWRSDSYSNYFGSENDKTPESHQVNLRAIFRDKDQKYSIIAYVQNVFDDVVEEVGGTSRRAAGLAGSGAANQVYYRNYDLAPPRTFGLEFQRRF